MPTLTLDLPDNAYSFLRESLRYVLEAEKSLNEEQWKYAILFLVQATELSMKAELHRIDPKLIFNKKGRTITPEECLNRLEANSPQADMAMARKLLETAVDWRNQIVHFKFSFDLDQARAVYSEILSSLEKFWRFDLELDEELLEKVKSLSTLRSHFERVAKEKLKNIEKSRIHDCPSCGNNTMVYEAKGDVCICHFCNMHAVELPCDQCGHLVAPSDLHKKYTGNFKRTDNWEKICSDCVEDESEGPYFA